MSFGNSETTTKLVRRTADGAWVVAAAGAGAELTHDLPEPDSATPIGTRHNRFAAYLLPMALAASIATPTPLREFRQYLRAGAETTAVDVDWRHEEVLWEPVLERITNEQVRELNALLAMPYTNQHGFEYLADE